MNRKKTKNKKQIRACQSEQKMNKFKKKKQQAKNEKKKEEPSKGNRK